HFGVQPFGAMTRTLGVTGGIGSGKTTVCRLFEALGARGFYADEEAKQLQVEDPAARREIAHACGRGSCLPSGALNRRHRAGLVFNEDQKRERINRIVHPRVFRRFQEARTRAEADGVSLLVHEAALIYESGAQKHLDAVAVVHADEERRIQRVMERDGVPREAVLARMEKQLPAEELLERADFVIRNDGDVDELRRQVKRVYEAMTGE